MDGEEAELPSQKSDEREPVTVEVALRALKRQPLSERQQKALHATHPEHLDSGDLRKAVGSTSSHQVAGLMGAFGRRFANTPGFNENARFFDVRLNPTTDLWEYRLTDTAREALEQLGLPD